MSFCLASHIALRRPSQSNDAHCRTTDRSEATLQQALASALLRPPPAFPSPPLRLLTIAFAKSQRFRHSFPPLSLPWQPPPSPSESDPSDEDPNATPS